MQLVLRAWLCLVELGIAEDIERICPGLWSPGLGTPRSSHQSLNSNCVICQVISICSSQKATVRGGQGLRETATKRLLLIRFLVSLPAQIFCLPHQVYLTEQLSQTMRSMYRSEPEDRNPSPAHPSPPPLTLPHPESSLEGTSTLACCDLGGSHHPFWICQLVFHPQREIPASSALSPLKSAQEKPQDMIC